ncbi:MULTISPECIES: Replicase polyprotein 1ab [unclassified Micromonospora]|uniref:Replicase polyprotein 1ab n=1 Tax=unclassified Micromonospora TaxID=2617518 RepID=UPI00259CC3E7|nr:MULTISPECIES: Replicase polyprotein 1ab [unclassified Micromonospora]MDM4779716.1 Replicase polyprotein 1ab [Micromonospora sp. b486]
MAETVARHLVATGLLIDEDPALALAHAMAARRLASRIAAVREAVGLAAYHAGEWQTAIAELRTYHRMTGLQSHLAVLADCERALGRPERAIDLFRGADRDKLDQAVAIELLIVAAGARGDLGQKDAAVAMLQVRELTGDSAEPWAARLRYAYADALLAVDRREEAREWFSRAADVDSEGETDAAERLLELDGVVIEGDDEPEDDTDASEPSAEAAGDDLDDDEDEDEDGDDDDDEDDREDDARLSGGDVTSGAGGDAARADDELTDAEAGSLAAGTATTPAFVPANEEPATTAAAEAADATPADEADRPAPGDVAGGEGEAAERR